MKVLYGIDHAIGRLAVIFSTIGMLCVGGILLATTAEMLMRTAFNAPIRGSLEVVAYMMVAATFLPLAYVRRRGDLISVRVVVDRLPIRYRKVHDRFITAADLIISVMLLAAATAAFLEYQERGVMTVGSLSFPISYVAVIIVAGLGLFVLEVAIELLRGRNVEDQLSAETDLDVTEGI